KLREYEPRGADPIEHFRETHAYDGDVVGRGPRTFGRDQRTHQDQRGDLLRGRLDGVALQDRGLPHLAFQLPEIQFVFPPSRIQLREFQGGSRPRIRQRGPQTQLVRTVASPPDAHLDLADLDPVADVS